MRIIERTLLVTLGSLVARFALVVGVMWFHDPFPVQAARQSDAPLESVWWEHSLPLTPEEVDAQQWLADVTYRLQPAHAADVWNVGGSQHGVFSIRYQAAFAGYAAAALGMRTPAYVGLTRAVLSNAVARLADRKAWSYIRSYWSQEPWYPDPCAKGNVMYTGHLMMLMALAQANGSNLRAMIRRPLPRGYFDGVLLERVVPDSTPMYEAYREKTGRIIVDFDGGGGAVTLMFRNAGNAPSVDLPDGVRGTWLADKNALSLVACGRVQLRLTPNR